MKKIIFCFLPYALTILLFLFATGCTDSRYKAEKLTWQAKRKTAALVKEKKGKLKPADFDKIISYYRKVSARVPLEPLAAQAQFVIADILLKQGKAKSAQKELKTIIDNFSTSGKIAPKAQFAIGRIFEAKGQWLPARREYEKIIDLYPMTNVGLNMPLYIMRHYAAKNDIKEENEAYRSALRQYNSLIQEYDKTSLAPVIKDYLARAYLQKGRIKQAISTWDAIDKDYPRSAIAAKSFLTKAVVYSRTHNIVKAIGEYQKFINHYPDNKLTPGVRYKMGMLYFDNSKIDKARDIFSSLIKEHSGRSRLHLSSLIALSYCYRKDANTNKVIETYNKIKQQYPKSEAALSIPFLIAQYYQEIKYNAKAGIALDEAIAEYKKLLLSIKKNSYIKQYTANLLTLCYLKDNKVDEAIKMLNSLSREHALSPIYLVDLATLYRRLNNTKEAIGVYRELLRKFPRDKVITELAKSRIAALVGARQPK